MSSAAVVIGALRVNCRLSYYVIPTLDMLLRKVNDIVVYFEERNSVEPPEENLYKNTNNNSISISLIFRSH